MGVLAKSSPVQTNIIRLKSTVLPPEKDVRTLKDWVKKQIIKERPFPKADDKAWLDSLRYTQ